MRLFAETYGWDENIAELYELLLEKINEEQVDESAWRRIEGKRPHSLSLHSHLQKQSILNHKNQNITVGGQSPL